MPKKSMNIDDVVRELRTETPRPEARVNALTKLRGRTQRVPAGWKWSTGVVAVGIIALPLVCKTPGTQSFAGSWQQVVTATKSAPIIHYRMSILRDGKEVNFSDRWEAGNRHAEVFRMTEAKIAFESRFDGSIRFSTTRGFEVISRPTVKEEYQLSSAKWLSLDGLLKTAGANDVTGPTEVEVDGKTLHRYLWKTGKWNARDTTTEVDVDPNTRRVLRMSGGGTGFQSVTTIEYPETVSASVFAPPPLGKRPRYDQDVEEKHFASLWRQNTGKAKLNGGATHLLMVLQYPGGGVDVVYTGLTPGADTAHPALLKQEGSTQWTHPLPHFNTIQRKAPSINANVFRVKPSLKRVTVKVPVYAPNGKHTRFVGYATFNNVAVHQGMTLDFYYRVILQTFKAK